MPEGIILMASLGCRWEGRRILGYSGFSSIRSWLRFFGCRDREDTVMVWMIWRAKWESLLAWDFSSNP